MLTKDAWRLTELLDQLSAASLFGRRRRGRRQRRRSAAVHDRRRHDQVARTDRPHGELGDVLNACHIRE